MFLFFFVLVKSNPEKNPKCLKYRKLELAFLFFSVLVKFYRKKNKTDLITSSILLLVTLSALRMFDHACH